MNLSHLLATSVVLGTAAWILADCTATRAATLQYGPPAASLESLPTTLAYYPLAELPERCGLSPERLVGCAIVVLHHRCQILVAHDLSPELELEVLEHEIAHCSGWRHPE